MSTNEYGLDADYFRRKLERVLRDVKSYKPDEMARELARMARTADEETLRESEFSPISTAKQLLIDEISDLKARLLESERGAEDLVSLRAEIRELKAKANEAQELLVIQEGAFKLIDFDEFKAAFTLSAGKGQLYAALPAAEHQYSTSSDRYRAELYDEVWEMARAMGYGNITEALVELKRMKAAGGEE